MSVFIPHPLDRGYPPSWASAWGEDQNGVFVAFEVDGVEQRLRWIRPGTFEMGSPENEAGRDDDEVQHTVTITQGFWLGETPCTQALWEAVMGENPSRFQSPKRPVEQVSFEDVSTFLERLGSRVPDLSPRLPTEAEWEYACRAGTETATYAGDLDLKGDNNAPVLHSIAWYGGNSGIDFDLEDGVDSSSWKEKQFEHSRACTHDVGLKQPNPWGLYDMLGNVYEWCSDRYGDYREIPVEDPVGPGEGTYRVFRGGSWNSYAQDVRAAYRDGYPPSDRNQSLGFRLARGQDLRSGRGAQ